ncbi:phage tail protein [Rosenbergiella collisarenosi]|uniref:tail protein X n=1 Tax=Rosenbergiella collisarenosi TaxID=1544695 RepID=UPI001BDB0641|nr:tail protein X [Rosenbergiella collisarenosi]MBT0721061.1 phage tail protein [Rosenbergiella collisarenosi]
MVTIYQTRDGDMLDAICAERYGSVHLGKTLVLVLQANPGLADLGAVYAAGVSVVLPELPAQASIPSFVLWE